MKLTTKPGTTASKATIKSIIELVDERIPTGKFKGLTKLLEPHEQPKTAKRSA
jgi:hypothetical protein